MSRPRVRDLFTRWFGRTPSRRERLLALQEQIYASYERAHYPEFYAELDEFERRAQHEGLLFLGPACKSAPASWLAGSSPGDQLTTLRRR
jgi:hypothetical protein